MGLDLLSESLKEISLVGIPAWEHASLYHKKTARFSALTWDDDATSDNDLEEKEEEYEKLTEQLWGYLRNIYSADESELKGQDPGKLVDVTLYGFVERVKKLLDLNGEEDEAAPATQGSPMPTYRASKYRAANFGFAAQLNKKKKVKPPTGKTSKN
jgi:hypothetical protein